MYLGVLEQLRGVQRMKGGRQRMVHLCKGPLGYLGMSVRSVL